MDSEPRSAASPVDSPEGTTVPRHIAATLDNFLAMVIAVVAAKQLPEGRTGWQIAAVVVAFLAYFFIFELAVSATPGKLMNGLAVRDFEGRRCSLRQTTIRTLTRLLEVNPLLFGGLPAAAGILWSRNKQRLGDILAKTVVVRR